MTPSSNDIDAFETSLHFPTLTEAQLQDLNTPITEPEINTIINSLPAVNPEGRTTFLMNTIVPSHLP